MEEFIDNEIQEEPTLDEKPEISWQLRTILMFVLIWKFSFGVSDAAVMALLSFLSKYFRLTSQNDNGESILQHLSLGIPQTLQGAYNMVGIDKNNFTNFIVCPQCNSVYSEDLSFTIVDGCKVSNNCSHISWPNHAHSSKRVPCGAILMKSMRSRNGSTTIQPFKIYPYHSLISAIQRLVVRDNFLKNIEHWRIRTVPPGFLCDMYEGEMWKEFLGEDETGFLQSRYNLCLTINVDWFQPFTHTRKLESFNYSVFICNFYRVLCWCYISSDTKPSTCYTIQEGKCDTYWVNSWAQRTQTKY